MLIVVLVIIFQVLGIFSAVHSIMSTRTPQGSIAWAVSLLALPYVSVPAYWIFGRNKFKGYVLARQNELELVNGFIQQANEQIDAIIPTRERKAGAITGVEKMARIPLTGGNSVELLVDGDATFSSIFAGIESASEYILIQFYIVRDDELGRELKERLIVKAKDGIRVLFLYDEIGSIGLPASFTAELRTAGVEIFPFHSRKGSGNRFQLNFRNHRKTVVVDGHSAWIGGHNVGDEYMSRDTSFGHWRDTHMRVEGPAVIGAQLAFVEDWRWAADESLTGLTWTPRISVDGEALALVVASGPADEMETASLLYTQAINSASRRIWIASPQKADSQLVTLAAYSFFNEVNAAGVNFYRYEDGFLHEKVMLIDDNVATVGTANFDNRSFRLNFEITTVVVDQKFAADVEKMFEDDFEKSRIMKPDEYDNKSYWFKLKVRTARLAAPVL